MSVISVKFGSDMIGDTCKFERSLSVFIWCLIMFSCKFILLSFELSSNCDVLPFRIDLLCFPLDRLDFGGGSLLGDIVCRDDATILLAIILLLVKFDANLAIELLGSS